MLQLNAESHRRRADAKNLITPILYFNSQRILLTIYLGEISLTFSHRRPLHVMTAYRIRNVRINTKMSSYNIQSLAAQGS